jgi:D-glycero-D-manno-heptose 1,7-bisphosphate phosphatase
MTLAPAVFLDRDGTLMEEVEYCRDPAHVRVLPGVAEGLRRLKEAGYRVVIVTNQSGIGRGWITPVEYEAVHQQLLFLLGSGAVDATYFCPDHPDRPTDRRKPGAGMLLEAARDLGLDLERSWLIGDRISDLESARRAGAKPILIQTGYGKLQEDDGAPVAPDFAAAVELILGEASCRAAAPPRLENEAG